MSTPARRLEQKKEDLLSASPRQGDFPSVEAYRLASDEHTQRWLDAEKVFQQELVQEYGTGIAELDDMLIEKAMRDEEMGEDFQKEEHFIELSDIVKHAIRITK